MALSSSQLLPCTSSLVLPGVCAVEATRTAPHRAETEAPRRGHRSRLGEATEVGIRAWARLQLQGPGHAHCRAKARGRVVEARRVWGLRPQPAPALVPPTEGCPLGTAGSGVCPSRSP